MKRREFLILTAGATAFSLAVPQPVFARPRILRAPPRTDIPGYFCFYDVDLEKRGEDRASMKKAEIVKVQGKTEMLNWGQNGHALRYEPEKAGDEVTFRVDIDSVSRHENFRIITSLARFHDEGFYQLLVDGEPFGEPHDCFLNVSQWIHGQCPVIPGTYEVSYRFTGEKNPKSEGIGLNLIWMEFDQVIENNG